MDWTTIAFVVAVIVVGGVGFYIMKPDKKIGWARPFEPRFWLAASYPQCR